MAAVTSILITLSSVDEYMKLPDRDVTGSEHLGCLGRGWITPATSKRVCDVTGQNYCSLFADNVMHAFLYDQTMDSYMNTSRCVGAQRGTNVSGGCGPTPQAYWSCEGSDGEFKVLATFELPPFLIAESCDNNPQCVGFVVNKVGSMGKLVTPSVDATNAYYLKVPSTANTPKTSPGEVKLAFETFTKAGLAERIVRRPLRLLKSFAHGILHGFWATGGVLELDGHHAAHPVEGYAEPLEESAESPPSSRCGLEQVAPPPPPPCCPGFVQLDFGFAAPSTATTPNEKFPGLKSVAFGPCDDQPEADFYSPTMDTGAMSALCASSPSQCTHFVSHDSLDSPQDRWSAWTPLSQANMTTYIRAGPEGSIPGRSACSTVAGDCGGKFLACGGRNTSKPLTVLETYDLPPHLLYQVCMVKYCDLFVSNNNGTGGTLYQFAIPPINATTGRFARNVTSYFLLP